VLRVITDPSAAAALPSLLQLPAVGQATAAGQLVSSRIVPQDEWADLLAAEERAGAQLILEHERVPFPSFPYEWPAEMLHAAGRLTLDLALALLEAGHGLKDATPYNVLFRGPRPVFVDLCSIEARDPDDYTWLAHAQFARTFLLPLLAHRDLGLSLSSLFLAARDGLEPEALYRMVGRLRRLTPPYLGLVALPTWLARSAQKREATLYQQKRGGNPERSRFILAATLKRQRRTLDRLAPTGMRASAWSGYMQGALSYSDSAFKQKEAFVEQALRERRAARVLDVGCNTGHFSRLAALSGAGVVAIDSDPAVVGEVWRRAAAEGLDILPLVIDLARPSAGIGWRNAECAPFLERGGSHFDLVLMLAVVHHLVVTDRIPLAEIVDLVAELTSDRALIEYVGPGDPCFRRIARGRDSLHAALSAETFETAFRRRFRIERSEPVQGSDRRLYLMTRG
jgi:2-polyprenyl-3-methyl-5-hydroxy-6-metoxy-1,4-benzoquinol methylase